MEKKLLVIAVLTLLFAGVTIALPIAKAPTIHKAQIRTKIMQKIAGIPEEKKEVLKEFEPGKLHALNAMKTEELKKFTKLESQKLRNLRNLNTTQLMKIRELKEDALNKIASLQEENIKKLAKLRVARIEKIAKTPIIKYANRLREEHLWRLSELSNDELEKIQGLKEKQVEKLAELPRPLLERAVKLPEELIESEELSEEDIEKLTALPEDAVNKLKGLGPAKIKSIVEKLPKIAPIRIQYLKARERYLMAKENYLNAKERFLTAKDDFRRILERYRNAPLEDKNELKEELLNRAVLVLTHQIEAAINRLESLRQTGAAPEDVNAVIEELNDMLGTLENEDVTQEEIINIANRLKELWTEKHKQAQVVVIKNMVAKLERLIERTERLLNKATELVDKMESNGLSEENIAKLREALQKFENDLQWLKNKVDEAKGTYLSLDQELAPGEIHKIAVKANRLAMIANKKIRRDYAFLMRLAHIYRALQHKEELEPLMKELPEPAEVSDEEMQEAGIEPASAEESTEIGAEETPETGIEIPEGTPLTGEVSE